MSFYGSRYLSKQLFRSYCSDLNVSIDPFYSDLELYEKEGVLLPVAHVVKPADYMAERRKADAEAGTYGQRIPGWEELEQLDQMGVFPTEGNDYSLWHPFDVAFELGNKFLTRPGQKSFILWNAYETEGAAVDHYYHYWQVHQVYTIQHDYPVFTEHNWILAELDGLDEARTAHLKPVGSEPRLTFNGKVDYYDALSFFIQIHEGERSKTFREIPEVHAVRRLNNEQYNAYYKRQEQNATLVARKYGLELAKVYEFLVELLQLEARYKDEERFKLAEVTASDATFLAAFLTLLTQNDVDHNGKEIAKINPWSERQLRHLYETLKASDYSQTTFERVLEEYNKQFPAAALKVDDIKSLHSFFREKGLFLIPYAIMETDDALNDPKAFRRMSLYVGMKNLTTGLEELLREIAKIKLPKAESLGSLNSLIAALFPEWHLDFKGKRRGQSSDTREFIERIAEAYRDAPVAGPEHQGIVRNFLIAYWARNLTGHYFTIKDDELYQVLYGPIFKSIYFTILYAWHRSLH